MVLLLGGASMLLADVQLYNQPWDGSSNLFASQNDTNSFGNFATVYDDFTLSSAAQINRIDWTGGYFDPSSQGPITGWTVELYSDNSGSPGGPLLSENISGTANETFLTNMNGFPIYDYYITPGWGVAAGTKYWLSVVPDLGFPPQWGWGTSGTGDGNGYQTFFGSSAPTGTNFAFTLTGSAVPEPSGVALFGLCIAGVGFAYRRMFR